MSDKDNLTLQDNPPPQGMPPPYNNHIQRGDTMPLQSTGNLPPKTRNDLSGHHASRSQEDGHHRPRTAAKPRGHELDIFADPPTPEQQKLRAPRMRRNSDSSINSRTTGPEDERRRRERHRREREARHRDGKGRPTGSSRPKKPNKQVDIIDSLDVTSIFGTGGESDFVDLLCGCVLTSTPSVPS